MGLTLGLAIPEVLSFTSSHLLSGDDFRQVVHTPVTKQYKLVPDDEH